MAGKEVMRQEKMGSLIGRRLGGYLIEQEIGRGAMGVVFKAKQLAMDRYVALKFLPTRLAQDGKVVARFLREARAAGQLSHPNLVNVHDAGVIDGLHFIAMELVDGRTVHSLVREKGPYSEKETLQIAVQVAAALKAAHAKGILHRDVKPDNFLIDSSGAVRLSDLGLARFQHSEKDSEASQSGTTVGTPHYMSPEQCSGGTVDERSDIYSLGASMYVLATGETPFEGPTAAAVMVKALTEPPRSLRQLDPGKRLSPGFVVLVEKMIAKDPAKRFQSAHETMDAIERCMKGQYKTVTREHTKIANVPLIPLEETPRYRLLLYGAAAAVLALAAAWFIVPRMWPRQPSGAASSVPAAGSTDKPPRNGGTSVAQPPPIAPKAPPASAKADPKAAGAEPGRPPSKAPRKQDPNEPPALPSSLAESTVMDEGQMAAVKKLSRLKQDLAEKMQQDPELAIARMQDFLNQHPGPRVANIAQEFLAKAKATKDKLDKDWAEARGMAEKEALAGQKAQAFHVLRIFVDTHPGTKYASTALGMMLGWVTDLRSEAAKAAAAGQYDRAVEMLAPKEPASPAGSKLPAEITGPLQKDLERYTAEREEHGAAGDADRKQLAAALDKAGAAARETDIATGRRYNFEESARICREGLAQLRSALHRKELDGAAGLYSRAAQMMNRMRLALERAKSVELPGLGRIKEPVMLTGWDEHGLTYKPKDLEAQPLRWRDVTADDLLKFAQAMRIASGKSAADLLDTGALAFGAGALSVAVEKLEQAIAADPLARAQAEAPLRLLKPAPPPERIKPPDQAPVQAPKTR